MQEAIAETLGLMVYFIVNKVGVMAGGNSFSEGGDDGAREEQMLETQAQQRELMEHHFFKMPFQLLEKSPNKAVQHGAALCLSKVIQNTPEELFSEDFLAFVTERILIILN